MTKNSMLNSTQKNPRIEQDHIWKKSGKLKKKNRCKTGKQQKRLIKIDIQTKLYVKQNI